MLAMCVGAYFCLSGSITLMDYFFLKGSFLVVKDKRGEVFVHLAMRKGESNATMTFRRGNESEDYKVDLEPLFDSNGVVQQQSAIALFRQNFESFAKADKKKN
jgi:hypothetical protein